MTGQMTILAAQAHVEDMHRRAEQRRRIEAVESERGGRRLRLRWPSRVTRSIARRPGLA